MQTVRCLRQTDNKAWKRTGKPATPGVPSHIRSNGIGNFAMGTKLRQILTFLRQKRLFSLDEIIMRSVLPAFDTSCVVHQCNMQ